MIRRRVGSLKALNRLAKWKEVCSSSGIREILNIWTDIHILPNN